MIKLTVKNIPPIKEAMIEVPGPGVTVLVGPNASGKTKLLLSMHLADSALRMWRDEYRRKGYAPRRLSIDPGEYVPGISWRGWSVALEEHEREGEGLAWSKYAWIRLEPGNGGLRVSARVGYYKNLVPKTFIPPFRALIVLMPVMPLEQFPLAYREFLLSLQQSSPSARSKCFNVWISYKPGKITFKRNGKELRWNEVASGWLELAPLELAIAQEKVPKPTRLIAVEEPEAHLHPKAVRCVIREIVDLVRQGYAFLITTHDPLIIEELDVQLLEGRLSAEELRVYLLDKGTAESVEVNEEIGIEEDPIIEALDDVQAEKAALLLGGKP
ncbi:MAG: AAA family ATPase [Crenarchaeota archaeon]|nr:AAA family ATPase [Thermoproteota archaeon]